MRILALDTATRATAVALLDAPDGIALEARDDPEPGTRPRHTTRLMGLIVELLDRSGAGWEAVDRIAVGVGPGTFTGLRIGVATARALAQATSIPLLGVSTLEALALGAVPEAGADAVIVPVLDARRGEVFAAAWGGAGSTVAPWTRRLEPRAAAPEALADELRELGPATLVVGDGAVEFRGVLERSGARIPDSRSRLHRVSAINHCRLAEGDVPPAPVDVRPEYLRLPDAELALRPAQRP